MKNTLVITLVIALILASYFLGRRTPTQVEIIKRDTIIVTRIDTIKIAKPTNIIVKVVDTILVPIFDTLRLMDTLYQILPRTQKYYAKDSVYQAWVSGYRPALDSINVFQKTVKETITIKVQPKKWGVGIIGGYGVGNGGLSPYAGVGLYYRIW